MDINISQTILFCGLKKEDSYVLNAFVCELFLLNSNKNKWNALLSFRRDFNNVTKWAQTCQDKSCNKSKTKIIILPREIMLATLSMLILHFWSTIVSFVNFVQAKLLKNTISLLGCEVQRLSFFYLNLFHLEILSSTFIVWHNDSVVNFNQPQLKIEP